jgi:hypothetical protein
MDVCRSDVLYMNNNRPQHLPNAYGRKRDKDSIEKYFAQNADSSNSFKCGRRLNEQKTAKRRSAIMKYRHICNGKKYSIEEAIDIYKCLLEYNNEMDEKAIEAKNRGFDENSFLDKKKDLSVFQKYKIKDDEIFENKTDFLNEETSLINIVNDYEGREDDAQDYDSNILNDILTDNKLHPSYS